MNIDPQNVHTFQAEFDAGNMMPPPYHYAYKLEAKLAEEGCPTSYKIQYLHREGLSEDEILEEGFTLNDDWEWYGQLPEVWQQAMKDHIQKHSWPKKPEKPAEGEASLFIRLLDKGGNKLFEGRPADLAASEYFLQELMQAIYEIAEREAPFQLEYREIGPGNEQLQIMLEASFAKRSIIAEKKINGKIEETINPEWKKLRNLMKLIYIPDYHYEKTLSKEPNKRGRYLFTGEGLWFKFGEGMTEPQEGGGSLDRLERNLKELFE